MSIASAEHAKQVNRLGARTITEMEDLKCPISYFKSENTDWNEAVNQCIKIVKRRFTGWTE